MSGTEKKTPELQPVAADPDQAWKALGLVNDWIKHAEAKTGASLAFAGAIGVLLYNLVNDQQDAGGVLWLAALVCGTAVLAAGASAIFALVPRLRISRSEDKTDNRLFFSHIAKTYKDDSAGYVEVLRTLTGQPEDLTRQIAQQIHANAVVAHRKFAWVNWAVRCLGVALTALGIVAAIVGSE